HPQGRGHDLGHRQRAARLPHRPVSDHGAGHEREDALDRAADGRWRPVRNRRRRQRTEACAAVRRGELPALGFAGRVPCARGVAGAPRRALRRCARARARRCAGRCERPHSRREPFAGAQGRRARQSRHAFLPGAVLGARAGRPEHRCLAAGGVRAARAAAGNGRGEDPGRADRGAGPAGGDRRLLPAGHGAPVAGNAPECDAQRRARGAAHAL
ncbi:MAG: Isocitrate dehydrogenase [NADP]; Monomeric isocitrate dehydrogenase [NADP], partial [uncultured Lysobacter sp.]